MKIKYLLIIGLAFIALIILNNEIAKRKTYSFYKNLENIDSPVRKVLERDEFLCDEAAAQTLVINLWATWCGPCQKEIPKLNELVEKYENENTLFIAITNQKENEVTDWIDLQKHEPQYFQLYEKQRLINYLFTLNPNKTIKKGRYPERLPTNIIIHKNDLLFFEQGFSEENITKLDSVLNQIQM